MTFCDIIGKCLIETTVSFKSQAILVILMQEKIVFNKRKVLN
jgi:hypothetical protein